MKTALRSVYVLFLLMATTHCREARAGHSVRVIESQQPGPTLMIVGIDNHYGKSGSVVVHQLQHQNLQSGKLILISQNSSWPGDETQQSDSDWIQISSGLQWEQFLKANSPAITLVLQESYDDYSLSARATGGLVSGPAKYADSILGSLHELQCGLGEKWKWDSVSTNPKTVIVTTSAKNPRKSQRPSIRQLEHRTAAIALLLSLDMVANANPHMIFPGNRFESQLRVAVYDDAGSVSSSGHDPEWLKNEFDAHPGLVVELINREDVLGGALEQTDVILFGGGLSNTHAKCLGTAGRKQVIKFVGNGGGYVGICAGTFLASKPHGKYEYLGLLDMTAHGNAGSVVTPLDWNESPLRKAEVTDAKFSGGPRLVLNDDSIETWATFRQSPKVGSKTLPLRGTPAVVAGYHGKGRVVCFSPHCERRPSQFHVVPKAIQWAAGHSVSDQK